MYEELMNHEDVRRSLELSRYFVIIPAFTSFYRSVNFEYDDLKSTSVKEPYHSGNETPLDKQQLLEFLKQNGLLEKDMSEKCPSI